MKKIISTLLILFGIILISIPFINKEIIKHNYKTTQVIVEKITAQEIEENLILEADYDYEIIKDVEITTTIIGSIDFSNKSIIGQLVIEDLGINLPILKGITNANLVSGAATMVPDVEMGKGNYSLAGHIMKDKSLLFGSLMDIEIGTKVIITDKKMVYEYEIYDTEVVPDTAFYMLDHERAEERGKPIISLMTCYYSSKTEKRFFALGELINEYSYDEVRSN